MVRSLAFAVALALGSVTAPVHALGLGDITTQSSLNQPFKADIKLLSVEPGEMDSVRVQLASQEAFQRAGVDRLFALTRLKFEPIVLPNGSSVIRVNSDFPIREPFLNFLVEVNWPRGRLLREYTVLLDPPVTLSQRSAPSVNVAPVAQPVQRAAPTPSRPAPSASSSAQEYRVQPNDTLWQISRDLLPRGVSMPQMMIALQRANPQAFVRGNINNLRRGAILRVPSLDEIEAISRNEAQLAYSQQQDDWRDQRSTRQAATDSTTDQTGPSGAAAASTEEQAELAIATARPKSTGEAGAGEDKGDEATVDDIRRELLMARENAETSRLESESLRSEVSELQKRLEDVQRLLSLKDEQLARLQDQVANPDEVPQQEAPAPTEVEAEAEPSPLEDVLVDAQQAAQEAPEPAPEEQPSETAEAQPGVVEPEPTEALEEQPMEPPSVATDTVPAEVEASEQPLEVSEQPPEEVAEKPQVPEETPSAPPEVEPVAEEVTPAVETEVSAAELEVLEQPAPEPASMPAGSQKITELLAQFWPYLLGAGALVLLLVLFVISKRRSSSEETDEAAEPLGTLPEEVDDLISDADVDNLDLSDEPESDTSFLSEFSQSDMSSLREETGEVDPVAEADVYIAYGRYQQAEELLQQSLQKDPERLALKHKLLEVHYATRDRESFNRLAGQVVEAGQDVVNLEAWTRAAEMGRELDPPNPLYKVDDTEGFEVSPDSRPSEMSAFASDMDLASLGADFTAQEAVPEKKPAPQADPLDMVEDVSLDLDEFTQQQGAPGDGDNSDDSLALDELDSLELELPELETQLGDALNEGASSFEVDDPTSEVSLQAADDENLVDGLTDQLDELSELQVLEVDLRHMAPDQSPVEDEVAEALGEATDKPISLDDAFDSTDDDEDLLSSLDVSELTDDVDDEDEVSTKLELAKAYLEMGDPEGARSILEEVDEEGDPLQKAEAQKMLASMG